MTDKFTLQEWEDAMRRDHEKHRGQSRGFRTMLEDVKAELTKPRVEFAEGEVLASQRENSNAWEFMPASYSGAFTPRQARYCRKLTTTEAGAGELIEVLEQICDVAHDEVFVFAHANAALDRWKAERGE